MFRKKKIEALELERNHLKNILHNIAYMENANTKQITDYAKQSLFQVDNTDYENKFK